MASSGGIGNYLIESEDGYGTSGETYVLWMLLVLIHWWHSWKADDLVFRQEAHLQG